MPYGEPRGAQPAGWVGTKGYVGGTKDTTGLTHLGTREYDPAIGRFISRDPVVDISDPQQMHGYLYAHNSPTTFADPTGLIDLCGNEGDCPSAPSDISPDMNELGTGSGSATCAVTVESRACFLLRYPVWTC